jgi:aspartate/methionine/tyrosine aminotransferase
LVSYTWRPPRLSEEVVALPLNVSSLAARRTDYFAPPPQWESMRKATALERDTGQSIVHLEKGDFQGPEFQPAPHVVEACERAVRDGHVRYVPGPGLSELREAIAAEATRRGRPTELDEVLVTMGAKHALTQAILTLVDPDDEVIFPDPGYPPDEFWTRYAGGVIRHVPLCGGDFQVDLDHLEHLLGPRTKLLILNTPQRPSGEIVGQLEDIAGLCLEADVAVLSDEIFSHIVYEPAVHTSITGVPGMDSAGILVDTFSKTYVMTGFRIGWCVADPELVRRLDIFQQNSVTNVPAFVQLAALAALNGPQDQVELMVERLRRKRDRCVAALSTMPGVECSAPPATFYVFPDVSGTGLSSQEVADFLVEEHAVGVVAGTAFGPGGEGRIRLTYAVPDDVLDEGLDRLRNAFTALANGAGPG